MSKANIPSTWNNSKDAGENLKRLIIAQSIGFNGHKGEIAKLLTDLVGITTVNGHLVYNTNINLKGLTCDVTSSQSKLLKLLVGIDDAGLASICSSRADKVKFNWRKRNGFAKADFSNAVSLMKSRLTDVASIEINSTMISYWSGKMKPNPDYVAGYWIPEYTTGTPPITYPAVWVPPVGEKFIPLTYDDRVPVNFRYAGANAFTADVMNQISSYVPFETRYNDGFSTVPESDIYRQINTSLVQSYSPTMVMKNSSGTDITVNYDDELKLAIVSMILINGSTFMTETGSLTKVSEVSADGGLSYIVTGKQTFSGTINQSFIDDTSDTYWYAHTQANGSPTDRIFPRIYDIDFGDTGYELRYGQHFWYWRDNNLTDVDIETNSNGLFTTTSTALVAGEIYLTVDGFKHCSYNDYGRWIFAMANITQSMNKTGFFGIGGFFGDLLKSIIAIVGGLVLLIIDVFKEIILLTMKVTGIFYMLEVIGLSGSQIELIAEVLGTIAFIILSAGIGAYASGSVSISSTATAMEVVQTIAVAGVNSMSIGSIASNTLTTGMKVERELKQQDMQEQFEKQRKKESEEKEEDKYQNLSGNNSIESDINDQMRAMRYNPFLRRDIERLNRYESLSSTDKRNPFKTLRQGG